MIKKIFTAVIIAVVSLTVFKGLALARTYPQPVGFVNDFANIISDQTEKDLDQTLTAFKESSSNELVVVTLSSLEEDVIENVAVELFQQWAIGTKEKDNGILLLIAPNERELKIEVGYGLEPTLTDSRAGNIIRSIITPEFKKEDYDAGIVGGVSAIQKVLTQDPTAFDVQPTENFTEKKVNSAIFGVIIFMYLVSFMSRSKAYWPGGIIGAILGLIFFTFTAAIAIGLFGLFLDYILSKNYRTRKKKGLPTAWWASKGGFGGGSGGSFGGFSGGSSGGGGSSGSW